MSENKVRNLGRDQPAYGLENCKRILDLIMRIKYTS
jgi:hypothetical protein